MLSCGGQQSCHSHVPLGRHSITWNPSRDPSQGVSVSLPSVTDSASRSNGYSYQLLLFLFLLTERNWHLGRTAHRVATSVSIAMAQEHLLSCSRVLLATRDVLLLSWRSSNVSHKITQCLSPGDVLSNFSARQNCVLKEANRGKVSRVLLIETVYPIFSLCKCVPVCLAACRGVWTWCQSLHCQIQPVLGK